MDILENRPEFYQSYLLFQILGLSLVSLFSFLFFFADGIWTGIFFGLSGGIGLAAALSPTKSL